MLRGDDGHFRCAAKQCSYARKASDLVRLHTIRCALFADAHERGRVPLAVVEGSFEKIGTLIQPCSRTLSEAAFWRDGQSPPLHSSGRSDQVVLPRVAG